MNAISRRQAVVLALAFTLTPVYAQQLQPLNPPLKNWAAPLYWTPTPEEAERQRVEQRIAQRDTSALAHASIFTAPGPLTFFALTPCRVMDTRSGAGFTGAFGPPSLGSFSSRVVPMPTSATCSIPANAGAYSLNITAVPPGVLSFLSVWPAGAPYPNVSTLNDPVSGGLIANAAIVVAGTSGGIQMLSSNITDVIIDINGYYAVPSDVGGNTGLGFGTFSSNTSGYNNTAMGYSALQANTGGYYNTAGGFQALEFNTNGYANTATGYNSLLQNTNGVWNTADGASALQQNTIGNYNTASGTVALSNNSSGNNNTATGARALTNNNADDNTANGFEALQTNSSGIFNTAIGFDALQANSIGTQNTASGANAMHNNTVGTANTANGFGALSSNTTGGSNTAIGQNSLLSNTTGSTNIGIGLNAASLVGAGNSNNIHIGSSGASGDSSAIRIGNTQTATFIAGIYGAGTSSGIPVYIDSTGKLGITTSSRRFKEQIADMGDNSSKLLQLRPVNFFYKPEYDDGSHLLQYGLIAEEVEKIYPEMVAHDKDGQILTVKYQMLAPMLLNEVQKQAAQNESQGLLIQKQAEAIQFQQEQNRKLEDRLAALEALLSRQ